MRDRRYVAGSGLGVALAALLACVPLQAFAQNCDPKKSATTPTERFRIARPGVVTDVRTGLSWRRCAEGQRFDGKSGQCAGGPQLFNWREMKDQPRRVNSGEAGDTNGFADWRVPNPTELGTLVERRCTAPAINLEVFPQAPGGLFWTYSQDADLMGFIWLVFFLDGSEQAADKSLGRFYLRLVRGDFTHPG